jgi:hypothetical protein
MFAFPSIPMLARAPGIPILKRGPLMKLWEATGDGASVSTAADDQDVDRPFEQLRISGMGHLYSTSSFFRHSCTVTVSIRVERGKSFLPARRFQSAVVPQSGL